MNKFLNSLATLQTWAVIIIACGLVSKMIYDKHKFVMYYEFIK